MPSTRWWEVVGFGLGVGVGAGAVLYYTNQVLRRLHKLENTVGAWTREHQTTLDRQTVLLNRIEWAVRILRTGQRITLDQQTVLLKRIATSLWLDTATPEDPNHRVAPSSTPAQGHLSTQGKGCGRGGDVNTVYTS